MNINHIRLFFNGEEYVEDRADLESAQEWVRTTLANHGHSGDLEWKTVGNTWRAGFRPDLDVYITVS